MTPFRKLTKFNGYYGPNVKLPVTEPVYVNLNQVTYIHRHTRLLPRYDLEQTSGAVQKTEVTLTIISFAAGLQEASDFIQVMEPIEEIL